MTQEFERYHGNVLAQMVHGTTRAIEVQVVSNASNSSYVVNGRLGLYIKYSTLRAPPWRFTFQHRHLKEFANLSKRFENAIVALVCADDGIVMISSEEFKSLVPVQSGTTTVAVSRRRSEKYRVTGVASGITIKVGMRECPEKLMAMLR